MKIRELFHSVTFTATTYPDYIVDYQVTCETMEIEIKAYKRNGNERGKQATVPPLAMEEMITIIETMND